jgi:SAM-dependent methyltransferase
LDLSPPADVIANLEKGLPFSDKTFDVVVALDVLEHTDNIHKAFDELCRIARKFVIITLPNVYEMKGRIKFLLGRPISGKYGLPPDHTTDRHRWLFSFNEARQFVHFRARKCGFKIEDEGCLIGPHRSSIVARALVSWFPNLFSPWYLVLLKRQEVNFP